MNGYRERCIEELAEKIVDKHCHTIKVNPYSIASAEGITISEGQYGNHFEAMIEYCSNQADFPFHVYLNLELLKHKNSLRGRSTTGHELGHYFIPEHNAKLKNGESLTYNRNYDYVENKEVELEADCFSGHLLLPPSKFNVEAAKLPIGLNAIVNLANTFETSRLQTALQYVKKDIMPPTVLVKWTADNKFHWKFPSPAFRKKIPNSYYFQFNPCRPTADYDLTTLNISGYPAIFGTTITNLSSWIYNIRPGSPSDILLIEQTISLGKYGGISLLYPAS